MNGGAARSCTSLPRACSARRGGFSLIELVVVLGVVMVLVGLALPSVGRSREQAEKVAMASTVRQGAVAIQAYCNDHRGVYPMYDGYVVPGAMHWNVVLSRGRYLPSARAADPVGYRKYNWNRVRLSHCMLYPWDKMVPGRVEPTWAPLATPVFDHWVVYPSQKGLLILQCSYPAPTSPPGRCFVGLPFPVYEPVAFADTSTSIVSRFDLIGGEPVVTSWLVGYPVLSTWGGCRARDR